MAMLPEGAAQGRCYGVTTKGANAQMPQTVSQRKMYWGNCQYIPQNNLRVLESGDWVSLLTLPSEFAYDEALLLCQMDDDYWVTWIPSHGEAQLCLRQFCPLGT